MQYKDFNYKVAKNGTVFNIKTGKPLTPVKKPTGYYDVRLNDNGKQRSFSHHRLVWESWKGTIPQGMQVNHINGIKADNRLENLELVTPAENQARRLNLRRGEKVNTAKLTETDVLDIRRSKLTIRELATKYSLHKSTIAKILSKKYWKHI